MALSDEVRRLAKKWAGSSGWPKRLLWLELNEIRGWQGQRLNLPFPIIAITGENGSGKSALLQAAACVYRTVNKTDGRTWFPSEFFPVTAWDKITGASIDYGYIEGSGIQQGSIRKPTTRWFGNVERPIRRVEYIDLNRIQPVGARVGYARIAKTKHTQQSAKAFDAQKVQRFSTVMGKSYDSARMALSNIDKAREVPVLTREGVEYSGFHQGSGEITVAELLQTDLPKYGLVVIDEIESSLHPRAQRRLIRDLAEQCRQQEAQIIISTHSPYILEELPPEARVCILEGKETRQIVPGISPELAMTKMDDPMHPEADLYVEDHMAATMLSEVLSAHGRDVFARCAIIPFGAANVGHALGQMVANKRFPRPSCVFLDGDSAPGLGCIMLPGGDAPEQVIFKSLRARKWGDIFARIGRDSSWVEDACVRAMNSGEHHGWITFAANDLRCGGGTLWQAMCAEWASKLPNAEHQGIVNPIVDALP